MRALSLLHRLGYDPASNFYSSIDAQQPVPTGEVGRNAPCPCGSERTYKACDACDRGTPPAGRVDWLYLKVVHWAQSGTGVEVMEQLAKIRSENWTHTGASAEAFADPFILDTALMVAGLFEVFPGCYAAVLPRTNSSWPGHGRRSPARCTRSRR